MVLACSVPGASVHVFLPSALYAQSYAARLAARGASIFTEPDTGPWRTENTRDGYAGFLRVDIPAVSMMACPFAGSPSATTCTYPLSCWRSTTSALRFTSRSCDRPHRARPLVAVSASLTATTAAATHARGGAGLGKNALLPIAWTMAPARVRSCGVWLRGSLSEASGRRAGVRGIVMERRRSLPRTPGSGPYFNLRRADSSLLSHHQNHLLQAMTPGRTNENLRVVDPVLCNEE